MRQPTRLRLSAWMLYFSVLFSAWSCAVGHGQQVGLQLSGLDAGYCSVTGQGGSAQMPTSGVVNCLLSSVFAAGLLAVFWGLFIRLLPARWLPALVRVTRLKFDQRWPNAHARASPLYA